MDGMPRAGGSPSRRGHRVCLARVEQGLWGSVLPEPWGVENSDSKGSTVNQYYHLGEGRRGIYSETIVRGDVFSGNDQG